MFLLIAASLAVWPRWIPNPGSVMIGYPRYSTPLSPRIARIEFGESRGRPLIALLLIAGW